MYFRTNQAANVTADRDTNALESGEEPEQVALMRDDLLTTTLESTEAKPILPVGALIGAAFFGGALAVTIIGGDNARRLGRSNKDFFWVLLGLAAGIATLAIWALVLEPDGFARSNFGILNRGVGFAIAGLFYMVHRFAYRAMQMTGRKSPSPWVPVICAVLAAIVLQSTIVYFFQNTMPSL